jgi:hypothetical protein
MPDLNEYTTYVGSAYQTYQNSATAAQAPATGNAGTTLSGGIQAYQSAQSGNYGGAFGAGANTIGSLIPNTSQLGAAAKGALAGVATGVSVGAGIATTAVTTGVITGATVGSAIPIPLVGTAIGAAAGAIIGFLAGWFSVKKKSYKDLVHSAEEIQQSHQELVASARHFLLQMELPPDTLVRTRTGMHPVREVKRNALTMRFPVTDAWGKPTGETTTFYDAMKNMAELPPNFDALKYLTDPMVRREVMKRLAHQGVTNITDADLITLGKKFGGRGQIFGEYDKYGRPKFYHGPNGRDLRVASYLRPGSVWNAMNLDVIKEREDVARRKSVAAQQGVPWTSVPAADAARGKRVSLYLIPGSEYLMALYEIGEDRKTRAKRIAAYKTQKAAAQDGSGTSGLVKLGALGAIAAVLRYALI